MISFEFFSWIKSCLFLTHYFTYTVWISHTYAITVHSLCLLRQKWSLSFGLDQKTELGCLNQIRYIIWKYSLPSFCCYLTPEIPKQAWEFFGGVLWTFKVLLLSTLKNSQCWHCEQIKVKCISHPGSFKILSTAYSSALTAGGLFNKRYLCSSHKSGSWGFCCFFKLDWKKYPSSLQRSSGMYK